ncbi:MAG: type VI secretion system tube protein Hcp [Gammaproteobacteria bacterium]|nr:type VI secretion system tube protein Hcp [Gammaproteobacteria bacterium]
MSIFMNYEGIKGESSDISHKGWMDIEELNWGVGRSVTSGTSTQGDRESSNANIGDLEITRHMDSATPKLFVESCCGTGKTVKIHLTKTGGGLGSDVYMEYTLKNALLSKYSVSAGSKDKARPKEKLTISFVDVEVKYTPYDDSGLALPSIPVGFDSATNTKR